MKVSITTGLNTARSSLLLAVALYTWCCTVFLTLKTLNKLDPIIEIHSSNKYSFVDHILFWRPPDMNVWDVETLMLALLKC